MENEETKSSNLNFSGEESEQKATPNEEKGKKSFDEILKEGYQSEFDRRVTKAIETTTTNLEKKYAEQLEAATTEAAKLAKMTAEQKSKYESEKKEKELSDRENAVMKRELSAQAKETLAEKGLPVALAEVLDYTNAESCNKSIEAVEKAFREAVEKGIEDRLKGSAPLKKAPESNADTSASFIDIIKNNQSKRK